MLIRPQLIEFSHDAAAQEASLQETCNSIQNWKNCDIGKQQRAIISDAGDASTVEQAIRILAASYSDLSWIYDMVGELCAIQCRIPFANIELRSSKNLYCENLLLHQSPRIAIYLTVYKKQMNKYVSEHHVFGPDMIINTYVKSSGAKISYASLTAQNNINHQTFKMQPSDGQNYIYDNREHSVNIIAEHDDVIVLRTIVKRNAFQKANNDDVRAYHYQQFSPHNEVPIVTTADETSARAQLMFSILRQSNCKDAIPIFKQWLNEDLSYDMRWYIMREFLALDVQSALPWLVEMAADDPHEQVRIAASNTLRYIRNQHPQIYDQQG